MKGDHRGGLQLEKRQGKKINKVAEIALVMIVRNEAANIGRCLGSIKPYVDEMIVMDTGSTDATVAIATAMGARVHHVAWQDNFAAARNAALDCSSADWNLILDGDEWIAAGAEQLHALRAMSASFIGVLPVASHFDLHGQVEVAVSWLPRLLPRGVRYAGRVHEQPVSGLPQQRLALQIGHDGYRREKLKVKKGRNAALLLQAIAEHPEDAYLHYQLGKDYEINQDYPRATEYYAEALRRSGPSDAFRHDLVVRTLFTLKQSQRHQEAIQFAEQEMPNWQHSPDFFFCLGDLLLDWAALNPERAVQELLPLVESSWQKCLELGEQPQLSDAVRGRGSYLAAHNLAVVYVGLGMASAAEQYRAMAAAMRAAAGPA